VCIVNGGIEMKIRNRKLVTYECANTKCGKLWALTPGMVIVSSERIFCGYDFNGRKKWRKSGECNCGTSFDYPRITVKELQESYGVAWNTNQVKGSE
tara:strand:- start:573 stop:863 length:291 start_codon:yes stop_codon:yes gene_type:complete